MLQEGITAVILFTLLILIGNPFHLWMPTMAYMIMFAALFAAFAVYASFILREKACDERDTIHRSFSGRAAFLAGSGVLVLGIIAQGIRGETDIWLVATLAAMIFTKLATLMYLDRRM